MTKTDIKEYEYQSSFNFSNIFKKEQKSMKLGLKGISLEMISGGEAGKITAINDLPMSSERSTVTFIFDGSESKEEKKIDSLIVQMNSFNTELDKVANIYVNFK